VLDKALEPDREDVMAPPVETVDGERDARVDSCRFVRFVAQVSFRDDRVRGSQGS
jgi:hypothetical protein